jgi:hypothetical protein
MKSAGILLTALMFGSVPAPSQPGPLDTSFGNNGYATSAGCNGNAVEMQNDGKILVFTGTFGILYDSTEVPPAEYYVSYPWIQRFTSDGELDPTFGTNGTIDLTPLVGEAWTASTRSASRMLLSASDRRWPNGADFVRRAIGSERTGRSFRRAPPIVRQTSCYPCCLRRTIT